MSVTSEDVAAYTQLVEKLARKHIGRAQAEFDDLVQEGYIAVFLSLKRGIHPSAEIIENRQRDYVRYLNRLSRLEAASYEAYLPTESPDERQL
jgi:DNA-directed RNA polymerase specialized sigma24 family protein